MTGSPSSEYRYWAFISYSSKDRRWAAWLHRWIERYGIPAQLLNHRTPLGEPPPKRLRPVFRDRDELPASSDLGSAIENALTASRFLIVICSPNAATSRWVDREVESFVAMGRRARILALVVDGEPGAEGGHGCFPPALSMLDPLAADARSTGDGTRGAILKLIAGMLGVSFDDLKQRDSRRQLRRLQGMLAGALGLVSVLAVLGFYAEQQREAAVAARIQAEELLDFLVFDMRDELLPLGRLDLMEKVQQRVDSYYRATGSVESSSLRRRVRTAALLAKGDRLVTQGDLPGASAAFRESLEIAEELALTEPRNAQLVHDLQVVHERLGSVSYDQGDEVGALSSFRKALSLGPGFPETKYDLSSLHEHIGLVLLEQGDLEGALTEYQASLGVRQRFAEANAGDQSLQRDLALSHGNVGDALLKLRRLPEAEAAYRDSIRVLEGLNREVPGNRGWQRDLSAGLARLAHVQFARKDGEGSLATCRQSLAISEPLAEAQPSNALLQRDVYVTQRMVGDALIILGRWPDALAAFRESMARTRTSAAAAPTSTVELRNLLTISNLVGDLSLELRDVAGAIAAYRESVRVAALLSHGAPTDPGYAREEWLAHLRLGDCLQRLGRASEGLEAWRTAAERYRNMTDHGFVLSEQDRERQREIDERLETVSP